MRRAAISLVAILLAKPIQAEPVSFRRDVAPILLEHCQSCHGPTKAKGELRLDSFASLGRPGESGKVALAPGQPLASELVRRLESEDPGERMPADADPLPKEDIAKIRRWIEEGAASDADPSASLAEIVPAPVHPAAPDHYPRTIPITALAFGNDGRELLVGGYHEITVWNPTTGQLLRRIPNQSERTTSLAVHPTGRWLAATGGAPGRMGEARIFDVFTGELTHVPVRSPDVMLHAAFSPSGDRLAVAGSDGRVHVLAPPLFSRERIIANHADWVHALAWSPDGARLATASRDRSVKVFAVATGETLANLQGHKASARGVGFDGDERLISVGEDKAIFQWNLTDARSAKPVDTLAYPIHGILSVGERWALFGGGGLLQTRSRDGKSAERAFAMEGARPASAAFDPSTKRLAVGDLAGGVSLWSVTSGQLLGRFEARP